MYSYLDTWNVFVKDLKEKERQDSKKYLEKVLCSHKGTVKHNKKKSLKRK